MTDRRRPRLARTRTGQRRAPRAAPPGAHGDSPALVGRLLILDEDSAAAAHLADGLMRQGHLVELFPDIDDAVGALPRLAPDVVLVDPWSGDTHAGPALIDRLRRMRDAGVDPPEVVVITAHRDVDAAVDALQHGASDFVVKGAAPARIRLAVGRALERRRLLNEHVRLRHDLALFAAAQRILETLDSVQLSSYGLDALCSFARADGGALFDEDRVLAERGLSEAERHAVARLPRPVNFSDQMRLDGPVLGRFQEALLLPLDDTRTAVLVGARGFAEHAEESCLFLARQLHTAFRNTARFAHAEREARRDSLTGLWNARAFQDEVRHIASEAELSRHAFSVLFIDVDHFKAVNDHHGHLTGSQVLVDMAEVLHGCRREGDLLARYGGDEFTVLLPDADTDVALQVAERIRRTLEAHRFHTSAGDELQVTVSVGVASFPRHARDAQALLELADRAMYAGKGASRNSVHVALPPLALVDRGDVPQGPHADSSSTHQE